MRVFTFILARFCSFYHLYLRMQNREKQFFIVILGLLAMIGPFNIDTCLPAYGAIAMDFDTSFANVERSMSVFFFGFGLGQLAGGYLSDLKGRRFVLTWGLIVVILGCIALFYSQSIQQFYLGRILQAIGGGFVGVTIATVVRDNFKGRDAASIMSNIMMIAMSAPLIAPSIGALLLKKFDWPSIFLFIGIYSFCQLVLVRWKIQDAPRLSDNKDPFITRIVTVYRLKPAWRYMLALSIPAGALYTYLTMAPFIYQEYFGLSESVFALIFGLNGAVLILMNKINSILVKKIGPKKLLGFGLTLHVSSLFIMLTFIGLNIITPALMIPLITLHLSSLGFTSGNATTLALEKFDMNLVGLANSQMRVIAVLFGSFAGFVASVFNNGSLYIPIGVMFCCSLTGVLVYFRPKNRNEIVGKQG
jgi:DHA1 family bicyclomycin/chloramphenicol resistance-like MFS transporter